MQEVLDGVKDHIEDRARNLSLEEYVDFLAELIDHLRTCKDGAEADLED